jgi:predicted DsbA family dithiol-disulfide isomerase
MSLSLSIDLVSDFVCPWCFIGWRRLQRALEHVQAQRPEVDVQVHLLPFFLNPDTPPAGESYRDFLIGKFGSAQKVEALHAQVREAGAPDVTFEFERIQVRPLTLHAHRLTYRAQALGATPAQLAALAEGIFSAHFQQGRNIGDVEVLADIATAAGDDRDAVLAYLNSDEHVTNVQRMAQQISTQGVTGVPFFILNRKLAVSGAQSVAVLGAACLQALE